MSARRFVPHLRAVVGLNLPNPQPTMPDTLRSDFKCEAEPSPTVIPLLPEAAETLSQEIGVGKPRHGGEPKSLPKQEPVRRRQLEPALPVPSAGRQRQPHQCEAIAATRLFRMPPRRLDHLLWLRAGEPALVSYKRVVASEGRLPRPCLAAHHAADAA